MKNNIKVKTNLKVAEYTALVLGLAQEYFLDNGDYAPYVGRLNAMRLFYNACVISDISGLHHNITDPLEMEPLVADGDFIAAFDDAIRGDGTSTLNFANAYSDALDIVTTKNSSFGQIENMLTNAFDSIASIFTQESLEKLERIVSDINNGKLSNQAIADAVGNSEAFNKILEFKKESES